MVLNFARVLFLVAGVTFIAPFLSVAEDRDLTGLYHCAGVNPNGSTYEGIAQIVRHERTYRVRWILPPNITHHGIGVVSGNVLAVSYFGEAPGVIVYKLEEGPRLVGEWTVLGADGRLFTETLTKMAEVIVEPAAPGPELQEPSGPAPKPGRVILPGHVVAI